MKIKTYSTISTEEMYKKYKDASNKEVYINEFIEGERDDGVNTKEDFFSLLLSEAIQQKDQALITDILKNNDKDTYPFLLANVDKIQMSPISYALLLDDEGTIKAVLQDFLNHGQYFQKITLTKEAFLKLKDAVGYQGEAYQECINDLIKPICIEQQVEALGEFSSFSTDIF